MKLKSIACAAALCLGVAAQATTIDLFSTSQPLLTDNTVGGGGLSSSVGGGVDPTILGGERDLGVELISDTSTIGNASIGVGGGFLSFSTTSLASGTGTVQWDGVDGSIGLNPTGLGGLGLTGAGFSVTTVFADGGFQFVIEAYTSATQFTKLTLLSSAVAAPTVSFIPFAAFSDCGFSGGAVVSTVCGGTGAVDFGNLGALQLIIDPTGSFVALDLTLDSVTTIPEPSTLALAGLGLLAAGVARARKQKR